jgi:hypothetical protein
MSPRLDRLFATQRDGRINPECEREDVEREFGRLAGLAKNEPLDHSNLSIGNYSERSACIGSTRMARRAGI